MQELDRGGGLLESGDVASRVGGHVGGQVLGIGSTGAWLLIPTKPSA
jgi:hypothetical protein